MRKQTCGKDMFSKCMDVTSEVGDGEYCLSKEKGVI
jgi:hypothetical protein